MRYRFILIIALLFLILCSCTSNSYYFQNKNNYILQGNYSNDSLVLRNYILFGTYRRERLDYEIARLDNDSLFNIFKLSLEELQIPIKIDDRNINLSNKNIIDKYQSRYKNLDGEYLKQVVNSTNKKMKVIIPVIKFNYYIDSHLDIAGPNDDYFICHFSLSIFIVHNNEIVYYKKMRHKESKDMEHYPYSYNSFHLNIPIPQEQWDGLVNEVMKEYIERLE